MAEKRKLTAEERLQKLEEKMAQLQAQKKKIHQEEEAKKRKIRTRRLIEIGAVMEAALGEEIDPERLSEYLNRPNSKNSELTIGQVFNREYKE